MPYTVARRCHHGARWIARSPGGRRCCRRLLLAARGGGARRALPRSFFEDWGWLAGPARVGRLRAGRRGGPAAAAAWVLVGAALSGLPMLLGVAVGDPLARRAARPRRLRRLVRVAGGRATRGGGLMDLGLRDRVALVTGASKGIGRGIAAGLAAEGARVAVASRSRERIDEAASAIGARGVRVRRLRSGRGPGPRRAGRGRPRADRRLHRQHRRPARGTRPARVRARAVGGRAPLARAHADGRSSSACSPGCASAASAASSRSARSPSSSRSTTSSSRTPTGPGSSRRSRSSPASARRTASRSTPSTPG